MTSTNLTRTEVADRAAMLEVSHYDISLDLTTAPVGASHNTPTFASKITISLTAKHVGPAFIDLRDAVVKSVTIDGVGATEAARYASKTGINLDLTEGDHTVAIDADYRYTNNGQSIHHFQDLADGETYLYSQFETADAKRVFTCSDQPDLKATYSIHVIAPKGWKVIPNSAARAGTTTDAHGNATDTFDLSVDVPLSTCPVATCTDPWYEVTDLWAGTVTPRPETPAGRQPDGELTIPLGIYCRQSIAEYLDVDILFKEIKEGFDFYAKHFDGPYPLGKYDQISCPECNTGTMGNAGCVTIRSEYVFRSKPTHHPYEHRNDTILREMVHMWSGDLITTQWWDDLWLNESFAAWSATTTRVEVSDYNHAWTTLANIEKARAYKQDQLPLTHLVAADANGIDTVEQNFDDITYTKSASALKQLATYIGQDVFPTGAHPRFSHRRFGSATFADLLDVLSEALGRDLSGWIGQWLTTVGITTLTPESRRSAGKYTSFAVTQDGTGPGTGQFRDHRISVGIYNPRDAGTDAVSKRTKRVEIDVRGTRTEVLELVDTLVGDVVLINDSGLTYSMTCLDEGSPTTVIDNIGALTGSMTRTLCWSTTWQMAHAGQTRARDFVNLVLCDIPDEDRLSVLERVIAQVVDAVNIYANSRWVDSTSRDLLAQDLLDHTKKRTDADCTLVFINALTTVGSSSSNTVDVLRTIYADDVDETGFPAATANTDMQRCALKALVSAGLEGEEAIAKFEETDDLALGAQVAIACRASVPTLTNKVRAWTEVMVSGNDAPSNLVIRHPLAGFDAPGSGEVLVQTLDDDSRATIDAEQSATSLSEHFFAITNSWWKQFSSETAQMLLEGFYSTREISGSAIAAAQRLPDSDETASPVKRIISEQQLLVKLALRICKFDTK